MKPILKWPDPRLKQKCEPFDWATDLDLINDLVETMKNNPRAIGLAAPQIGIMKRFFVVRPKMKIGHPEMAVLVNPKVVKASSIMKTQEEECMSFPGVHVMVQRPMSCRISFELGPGQGTIEQKFLGLVSRCMLHEIDHLEGINIQDYKRRPM